MMSCHSVRIIQDGDLGRVTFSMASFCHSPLPEQGAPFLTKNAESHSQLRKPLSAAVYCAGMYHLLPWLLRHHFDGYALLYHMITQPLTGARGPFQMGHAQDANMGL